ncbi:hypothetical protein ACK3SF_04075 [Candidatus Nanosalina sp. VS9-1]|uniref:cupredoxin domain-containing protein n=1 Tax=Candidatus Nanosalina sp. VS9-1 TaxID=3388566 RepID=UPI0039DF66B0
MKYWLTVLIAVTLALSACTSDVSQDAEKGLNAAQEASESDVFTVKYTDSGFVPENIVIREGDSVRWIDRSSRELFITTEYDTQCPAEGFSSCENIQNYSYSFSDSGRYIYRNGHEISDQAVITVQQKSIR